MVNNIPAIEAEEASFNGQPVTLDSEIIRYGMVYSLVVVTMRQTSAWQLKGSKLEKKCFWTSTLVTLFVGWWGVPFGLIFTPVYLMINLTGSDKKTIQ